MAASLLPFAPKKWLMVLLVWHLRQHSFVIPLEFWRVRLYNVRGLKLVHGCISQFNGEMSRFDRWDGPGEVLRQMSSQKAASHL